MLNKILAGTGLLIGIFLFLTHSGDAVKIISGLSTAYTSGVKTLQGR